MEISAVLTMLFAVLFISILIAWTVLSTVRPKALESLSPSSGSLGVPVKIKTSPRDMFLTPAGATLTAFIFWAVNNKTPAVGASQDPMTILKLGSALQLQILPGGASTAPRTQLVLQTQGPANSPPEVIDLANFPQQQWVHVAIVREGRRYTVYYNGTVAGSSRTQYFPVINSSDFTIGDTRLRGEFGLPKLAPTPYSQGDIQAELVVTADTKHEPYLPTNVWASMSTSFKLGCPNGLFCFSTSAPPQLNPLKTWSTPYA